MSRVNQQLPTYATGGCLCGAVRYTIHGPLRDVVNCHCEQCRRTHGHFAAYSAARCADLRLLESRGLKWYMPADGYARRGFCGECGASLFWEPLVQDQISIAAGTLDQPTGLQTIRHIFVKNAGDYYELNDDLEKLAAGM